MQRDTQSRLIKQAATMATLALEMPATTKNETTLKDLNGYKASLTLVKDSELRPFAEQARSLVIATIRYLKQRLPSNLESAHKHRDRLSDAMLAHLEKER